MGDSYSDPNQNNKHFDSQQRESTRSGHRGNRGSGNRDSGGFRIRLSDNEMRAARSLQEAFNLRSTVAVLGFALRTLAQMLEEGKLADLVEQYRSQAPRANPGRRNRFNPNESQSNNPAGAKPNPFARPEKPQNPPPQPEIEQAPEEKGDGSDEHEVKDLTIETSEKSLDTSQEASELTSEDPKKEDDGSQISSSES